LAPALRILIEKVVPPALPGSLAYDLDRLSVACV
jgi:hypothetical protein